MGALGRKWRAFGSLPLSTRLLVPLAIVLLALARIAILVLPFRLYAPLFGRREGAGPDWRDDSPPGDRLTVPRVAVIATAVRASARLVPWNAVCLPQAMTAAVMLRMFGIGYAVHLGVARETDGRPLSLAAHAWCVAAGRVVTGPGALDRFARVARFVHDPVRPAR